MKVCIFQGLEIYHYEMIGYLAEYFINNDIFFEIIANKNNISIQWQNYYNSLFNRNLSWIFLLDFEYDSYDYIFLLSDDDPNYIGNYHIFKDICSKKIISIDHHYLIRNNDMYSRISVRFFNNRPENKWILPCYNGISKYNKQQILNSQNNIIVTCIGSMYPKSIIFLKKLLINFDDIEFNIITRKYTNELINVNNINIFEMCPTNLMFEIISKSNYIFCNETIIEYEKQKMSGVIPLSFSYGCQLILPESWNKFYSFTSVIEYNINTKIILNKNNNLDEIYNELYYLQNQKQIILSDILKLPKKYNLPIINFIKKKVINVPTILIDFNSCINLYDYKKDFIEIHTLNKIINKNNFIYEYESEENLVNFLCNNITNPVIIYLNFNNYISNINELFNLIKKTKRLLYDIIILRNINLDDNIVTQIKKIIKKIVWSEFYENSLIIMSQNIN